MKQQLKKVLSLFTILCLLIVPAPGITWGISAPTYDLELAIDTYNEMLQSLGPPNIGNLSYAVDPSDNTLLHVTGNAVSTTDSPIELTIPENVTVKWEANILGQASGTAYPNYMNDLIFITPTSAGTFELADGGNISVIGEFSIGITQFGTGDIVFSGGTLSAIGLFNSGLYSTSTGSAVISGGQFIAEDEEAASMEFRGSNTILVSGGTFYPDDNSDQTYSIINESNALTITGGSIFKDVLSNPKNESGDALYPVTVTLDGIHSKTAITAITEPSGYGINDVYTDENGKLYFMLPSGLTDFNLEAGGTTYTGNVQINSDEVSVTLTPQADVVTPPESIDITADFTDGNFLASIRNLLGKSTEQPIYDTDVSEIQFLDIAGLNIKSLNGLEHFTNLEQLVCAGNPITSIDIHANTKLKQLDCSNTKIQTIDFSGHPSLQEFYSSFGILTDLNLSDCPNLTAVVCSQNCVQSVDLSGSPAITTLALDANDLQSIDLSDNVNLNSVNLGINRLSGLDLSHLSNLTHLDVRSNQLTALDVSNNTALLMISCFNNQLTTLDLSNCTLLKSVYCFHNQLTSLSIPNPSVLNIIDCSDNRFTELDVSAVTTPGLILNCSYNNIPSESSVLTNASFIPSNLQFDPQYDPEDSFVAVSNISSIPRTAQVGTPLVLSGSVEPANASYSTIQWRVAGDFEMALPNSGAAQIENGVFTALTSGTYQLYAEVENGRYPEESTQSTYDQVFYITAFDVTEDNTPGDDSGDDSSGNSGKTFSSPAPAAEPSPEVTLSGGTAETPVETEWSSEGHLRGTATDAQITAAIDAALGAESGNAEVVLTFESPDSSQPLTGFEAIVSENAINALAGSGISAVTLQTPMAEVTFDANAQKTLAESASGDVILSIAPADVSQLSKEAQNLIGNRPAFDFSITSGGEPITEFGGTVTVAIPYTPEPGESTDAIIAYFIAADGTLTPVTASYYDAERGCLVFETTHFSTFSIGYNVLTFSDVDPSADYASAVAFVSARGIAVGSGDTFEPNALVTRAQFTAMIMNAYGIAPDETPAENFSDAGNTWYTGYLSAAKRVGISTGTGNNLFSPDQTLTHETLFTLLYNTLGKLEKRPSLETSALSSPYTGSAWAEEAVSYMTALGLITNENTTAPDAPVTRAEMAEIFKALFSGQF